MESTPKKRENKDLWCENCSQKESTILLFWEKYHIETGRLSLINPSFICDTCKTLFSNVNELFENMPRLVPFDVIANKWDRRNYGILSKKGYEFNALSSVYFKKKIWRIKFIWKENGKAV